jgi:hypothetical protein
MHRDETAYLILAPIAFGSGVVRGFAGFGGPLLMLPILNLYLVPAAAIWVMMWVDILVNVRLLPEARRHVDRNVLTPLVLGTLASLPVGVHLIAVADPVTMRRVIGATILAAAIVLLSGWRYPWRPSATTWVAAGMMSGVIVGATSIAVTVALVLAAARQTAVESRANFIVWCFLVVIVLLALLVLQGAVQPGYLQTIGILAPLYLVGTITGAGLQGRAPEIIVRRAVLLLAAAIGAASAIG